jgi:hypothetical protein
VKRRSGMSPQSRSGGAGGMHTPGYEGEQFACAVVAGGCVTGCVAGGCEVGGRVTGTVVVGAAVVVVGLGFFVVVVTRLVVEGAACVVVVSTGCPTVAAARGDLSSSVEPAAAATPPNASTPTVTAIFTPSVHGRRTQMRTRATGKQRMNETTRNHGVSNHGCLGVAAGAGGGAH